MKLKMLLRQRRIRQVRCPPHRATSSQLPAARTLVPAARARTAASPPRCPRLPTVPASGPSGRFSFHSPSGN